MVVAQVRDADELDTAAKRVVVGCSLNAVRCSSFELAIITALIGKVENESETSPVSIASSRYFQASSGRFKRSLYSMSPPEASTSSP